MKFLLIGIGGFWGAIARYSLYRMSTKLFREYFFVGTLIVNILGCFLAGFFLGLFSKQYLEHPLSGMLFIGFLGAFTTFSALASDVLNLTQMNKFNMAATHAVANITLSIVVVFLGNLMGKYLNS